MARKVGKVILIIDDEAPVRRTLCLIFEASGYEVLNAETAKEGIHLFINNPVDLVLLDFRLPDDGTWIGKEMKRRKPGVPIIVLSGAPEAVEAKAYADALLPKPTEPPDLLEKVAGFLPEQKP
jgi:two-component system, OmpR family, phosphate regulon response regulator PhoB